MQLSAGHGVAESVLGDLIQSYIAGRDSHMADGWEFSDPLRFRRRLASLVNRWRREDGLKTLPLKIAAAGTWAKAGPRVA